MFTGSKVSIAYLSRQMQLCIGDAMTTQSPETQREPSYRDAQLHKAMRLHRAAIKTNPQARKTLAAAEYRLKYLLRVLAQWDDLHAEQAEKLITLGNLPAANVEVTLIFNPELRAALYPRCYIGAEENNERLADVVALDRLVLE